jgi:hypothetical protein
VTGTLDHWLTELKLTRSFVSLTTSSVINYSLCVAVGNGNFERRAKLKMKLKHGKQLADGRQILLSAWPLGQVKVDPMRSSDVKHLS